MSTLDATHDVRKVSYGGRWWTLAELAGYARIDRRTLQSRLDRGLSVSDAVSRSARDYPRGVRRSHRAETKPAAATKQLPECNRCGAHAQLQRFADEWRLCTQCAMLASIQVRAFVLRQR